MRRSRYRGDCSTMAASSSARDRSGSTSTSSAGRPSSGGSTSTGRPSCVSQQRQPAVPSGAVEPRSSGAARPGGTSVPSNRSVCGGPAPSVSVTRYRIVQRSSLSRGRPGSTSVTRSRPSRSSGTDAFRADATFAGSAAATNHSGSSRSGPSTSTTVISSAPDCPRPPRRKRYAAGRHLGNPASPACLPRERARRSVGRVGELTRDRAGQPAGGARRVGSRRGRYGHERAERHDHGDDDGGRPLPSPAESLCVRQLLSRRPRVGRSQ